MIFSYIIFVIIVIISLVTTGCNNGKNNENELSMQTLRDSISQMNDSIKILNTKTDENKIDTPKELDFNEFAREFRSLSLKSKSDFMKTCESTILTFDYENGNNINENPEKSYDFIFYYLQKGKMKIGVKSITFSVPEGPDYDIECVLYFRLNENKEWRLYKYNMPA